MSRSSGLLMIAGSACVLSTSGGLVEATDTRVWTGGYQLAPPLVSLAVSSQLPPVAATQLLPPEYHEGHRSLSEVGGNRPLARY